MVISIDIDCTGTQASHQILVMRAHQDRLTRRDVGQQEVDHDVALILVEPIGGLIEH